MKLYCKTILFLLLFSPANLYSQQTTKSLYKIADSLFDSENYNEADSVLRVLKTLSLTDSIRAEVELRLGATQRFLNNYDSGISFLRNAAFYWAQTENHVKLGRTNHNIGILYSLKRNTNEAFFYYREALKESRKPFDSAGVYIGLSILWMSIKEYDSAYKILQCYLSRYPNDIAVDQSYYKNIISGNYFLSHQIFDSALHYFKKTLTFAYRLRFKANVFNDIGRAYFEQGKYAEAFLYADSSYAINRNDNWTENLLADYDLYTKLYEVKGNYPKAYAFAQQYRHLSDTFFDVEKNNAMIDANAKYQNQKILTENALKEQQRSISQRNFIIALSALAFIALLAFVSLRISRLRKKANQKLSLQKEQVQQLADELAAANDTKARLFSTIGHDLRSPVSSLYALLKMQELKGNSNDEMSGHTVQLLDTLEDLLVWSKSQMEGFVLQPVKINLYSLCEELQHFYTGAAQAKNVSLVNDAAAVQIRTDENILKTMLRNAISNAIAHTGAGNAVTLTAESIGDDKAMITVKNPCSETDFDRFKNSFENAAIKSNTHGLGIVLMKEFAQKINARITLSYEHNHAVLKVLV